MIHPIVYLVGAGPGDPGLLTVAAAEVLKRAAVVIYDYLANPELLKLCPPSAELIYVGKSANQHTKTQDEINALLLEKAQTLAGQLPNLKSQISTSSSPPVIVRLKGGDPFVFGRGGEEAEFLHAHNIPFQIIPGITAGIAAPAYAGIPVTHRDFTSTITLITGHEKEEAAPTEPRVNYTALAQLDGTLVFYMGVKSLPQIVERLTTAGMNPATPAAVIRWGTRPDQRTVTGTLATIVEVVRAANITAPAITIVGRVVTLRDTLNWFEHRPLFGQRFLVTRTRQQVSTLSARLADLGAQVIEAPTIEIVAPTEDEWEPIDKVLQQIPAYDWVVFTSANGVRAAWDRLRHLTFDARHFGASHIAAIGPATKDALEQIGITPDVLPEKFIGEELAAALQAQIGENELKGQRFLLLRADIARPILHDELVKLGGMVEDLAIYRTIRPKELPPQAKTFLQDTNNAWITFTSASTAENLWQMLTEEERAAVAKMRRASIGPITSAALSALGNGQWKPTLEAQEHTIEGLVKAIADHAKQP